MKHCFIAFCSNLWCNAERKANKSMNVARYTYHLKKRSKMETTKAHLCAPACKNSSVKFPFINLCLPRGLTCWLLRAFKRADDGCCIKGCRCCGVFCGWMVADCAGCGVACTAACWPGLTAADTWYGTWIPGEGRKKKDNYCQPAKIPFLISHLNTWSKLWKINN